VTGGRHRRVNVAPTPLAEPSDRACTATARLHWAQADPDAILPVHLQDRGVVHEPVAMAGSVMVLSGEDLVPFTARLISRDQQGSPVIAGGLAVIQVRLKETASLSPFSELF